MLEFIRQKLLHLKEKNLLREPKSLPKNATSFADNSYLSLQNSWRFRAISTFYFLRFRSGIRASKYLGGQSAIARKLEEKICQKTASKGAVLLGSGYMAMQGVIAAFDTKNTLIIADRQIHASFISGVRFSKFIRFKHNDSADLTRILDENRSKFRACIIATETVFSMSGEACNVADFLVISQKYDCILITDDAHGLGVIDAYKNTQKYWGHIRAGTFSKAACGYGGYLCVQTQEMLDFLQNFVKSQIYSTALPSTIIAQNIAGLHMISRAKYPSKPLQNAQFFCQIYGLNPPKSAIVMIDTRSIQDAEIISNALLAKQIYVPVIRPPTTKNPSLRLAFTASHTEKQIKLLAKSLDSAFKNIDTR